MTMTELKDKARSLNIPKLNSFRRKSDLIWAIQESEGYNTCFKKIEGCGIAGCCFRDDCCEK